MTNSAEVAGAYSNTEPLVRPQTSNGTNNEEPDKSNHRTAGAYGGSAPVSTCETQKGSRPPRARASHCVELRGFEPLTP